MSYRKRLTLLMLLDSAIVVSAIFIASWIVYPSRMVYSIKTVIISSIALLLFHHLYAIIFKLYHKVWAYASIKELQAIVYAVTLSNLSTLIIQFLINDFTIYRRAMLITWLLHITLIGGSRFTWRVFRDHYINPNPNKKRTLIVGAGSAGVMIVRQLTSGQNDYDLKPVGFVDDDIYKQRMEIFNLPVLGTTKDIQKIVKDEQIEHIVIAIPSLRNGELTDIISHCNETEAKVQILPKIEDLA